MRERTFIFSNLHHTSTCTSCYKCEISLYTKDGLLLACSNEHLLSLHTPLTCLVLNSFLALYFHNLKTVELINYYSRNLFFDIGKCHIPRFAGRKKKTKIVRMRMLLASGVLQCVPFSCFGFGRKIAKALEIIQYLPPLASHPSGGKDLHDIVRDKVTAFESFLPSRGS